MTSRLSTGIPRLDNMLGGGLLPGTLTVVADDAMGVDPVEPEAVAASPSEAAA